jgi:hypothetical protein
VNYFFTPYNPFVNRYTKVIFSYQNEVDHVTGKLESLRSFFLPNKYTQISTLWIMAEQPHLSGAELRTGEQAKPFL